MKYCEVAYRAAREVIAPGRTEIDVYNAMVTAINQAAGTTITFAGDFACGERGSKREELLLRERSRTEISIF